MWNLNLWLLVMSVKLVTCNKSEPLILYYYGLEESERSLPECRPRQACSVLLERYWRPSALVRLCRCARRFGCPINVTLDDQALELNNRAQFKFCKPVTTWPECQPSQKQNIAVTVESETREMNPDTLEELHHKNIQLTPPKIIFNCRCQNPNYWKISTDNENDVLTNYMCSSLPLCNSGEFCGNVNYHLYSLYQTCLCPKNNMCIPDGGLEYVNISEMLYQGKGKRAYCRQLYENDYSYEL